MKSAILLTSTLMLTCSNLYAATPTLCNTTTCPTSDTGTYVENNPSNCKTYTRNCYKGTGSGTIRIAYSCTSCPTGQNLISTNIIIECTSNTYNKCGCTNGCSTTAWTAKSTGYEVRDYCNTTNCTTTKEYRCARGYYGTSTNGTSGCTRCPASGGIYGTTPAASSTVITSCYIPSGNTFSDSTGSGTYTGNCYYKN